LAIAWVFIMTMILSTLERLQSLIAARLRQSSNGLPVTRQQGFPNLIIERLYYAEGRHHPDHPLHGEQIGLAHW